MSNKIRIFLIIFIMAATIAGTYWYMQETTGKVEVVVEKKWRLHDNLMGLSFCDDDLNGWAVGHYGTIVHSTNGGKTWEYQQSGVATDLFSVWAKTPETAWAVGNQGVVIHTVDGGKSWKKVQVANNKILYNDICFLSATEGFIVGEFSSILHTTDGGTTWQRVFGGEPPPLDFSKVDKSTRVKADFGIEEEVYTLNSIYFRDPQHGWAAGEMGIILATTDGGTTWEKQTSGTEHSLTDIEFFDTSFGLAVGLDGIILKTLDGGATWTQDKPSVITHYYGVTFKRYGSEIERKDAIAVGQGVIATYSFYKKDYLQNWVPALEMKYKIDFNWVNRVAMVSKTGERLLAVGQEGLILVSESGGNGWDMTPYAEKPVELVLNP
jgi:photosystem II stability/assembly factor-like uncharacterized protein